MIGRLVRGAAFATAATAAYVAVIRPWHLRWGSRGDEVDRPMPGDDLILLPRVKATHAITIRGRAADAWPILIEMSRIRVTMGANGTGGGAASVPGEATSEPASASGDVAVGDRIRLSPGMSMTVIRADAPSSLVYRATFDPMTGQDVDRDDPSAKVWVDYTWSFVLDESDAGGEWRTRLVARFRADYSPLWWAHALAYGGLEPGQFVMERQLLLGIRDRVERFGQAAAAPAPAA
jgi:hypothetical protein